MDRWQQRNLQRHVIAMSEALRFVTAYLAAECKDPEDRERFNELNVVMHDIHTTYCDALLAIGEVI